MSEKERTSLLPNGGEGDYAITAQGGAGGGAQNPTYANQNLPTLASTGGNNRASQSLRGSGG